MYEKSSFYMLEFFKYFHILTTLLTMNNNILFIPKNIFRTKIVTQKNIDLQCYFIVDEIVIKKKKKVLFYLALQEFLIVSCNVG